MVEGFLGSITSAYHQLYYWLRSFMLFYLTLLPIYISLTRLRMPLLIKPFCIGGDFIFILIALPPLFLLFAHLLFRAMVGKYSNSILVLCSFCFCGLALHPFCIPLNESHCFIRVRAGASCITFGLSLR